MTISRASTASPSRRRRPSGPSLLVGLGSVALAVSAQSLIVGRDYLFDGILLGVVAITLALRTLPLDRPAHASDARSAALDEKPFSRVDALAIGATLLVATICRASRLSPTTPSSDWIGLDPLASLGSVAGVGLVALIGRELLGRRVGLAGGWILAAAPWHAAASLEASGATWAAALGAAGAYLFLRGYVVEGGPPAPDEVTASIGSPVHGLARAASVGRALRSRRWPLHAAAGASLGLAVQADRAYYGLLLSVGLYLTCRALGERWRPTRPDLAGLVAFALAVLFFVGPLAPRILSPASSGQTPSEPAAAALSSRSPALAMLGFHVASSGAAAGADAPALDPLVGGLLVLGVALALRQAWRPESALILAWLALPPLFGPAAPPGAAPATASSLAVATPVALLAALPISALWRKLEAVQLGSWPAPSWLLGSRRLAITAGSVVAAGLLVGILVPGFQWPGARQAQATIGSKEATSRLPAQSTAIPAIQASGGSAGLGAPPEERYVEGFVFGGPGQGAGQLRGPRGVAVDARGGVYVADTLNARVHKYAVDGRLLWTWGGSPGDGAALREPVAVAIAPDGSALALDGAEGWVARLGPDGRLLEMLAGPAAQTYHPRGLWADASGGVYLADTGGSRILKLGAAGQVLARYGEKGRGVGQILEPTDVVGSADGGFYVADSANSKVVRFDAGWRARAEWPIPRAGSVFGQHLAVAGEGRLLVSDPEGRRVLRYGRDGQPLGQIGGDGWLSRPLQVAVDRTGALYVADSEAHRVVKLVPSSR